MYLHNPIEELIQKKSKEEEKKKGKEKENDSENPHPETQTKPPPPIRQFHPHNRRSREDLPSHPIPRPTRHRTRHHTWINHNLTMANC